jgi:hypothetical protein
MRARPKHIPDARERNALRNLREAALPPLQIGSLRIVATLASRGWIERDPARGLYRITLKGKLAMRLDTSPPQLRGPHRDVGIYA